MKMEPRPLGSRTGETPLSVRALLTAVAALAALVVLAPASFAATRYAAPGGSGPAATCPQSEPCDIQDAVEDGSVEAGDDVVLLPGEYATGSDELTVNAAIDVGGRRGDPLPTIVGSSPFGVARVLNSGALLHDAQIIQTENLTALQIAGGGGTGERLLARSENTACAVSGPAPGEAVLRDSVCRSTGTGTSARGVDSSFGGAAERFATLRNLTVYAPGASARGILALANSGAKVTAEGRNLLLITDDSSGGIDAAAVSFDTESTATIELAHSNYRTELDDPAGGATVTDPGTAGNQTAVPLLSDPASGEFQQLTGSPTIDAGIAGALLGSFDFGGEPRVQGAAVDIGADELTPPPPEEDEEDSPPPTPLSPIPPPATDSTAPGLWGLRLAPRAFALARAPTAVSAARKRGKRNAGRRVRRGTVVRYRLSEAARAVFLVQRGRPGLRRGARGNARCVRPTRRQARRGARRCVRWRRAGPLLRRQGRPGLNRFRFTGRIGRRALRPGRYRLLVRATDAAGNRSKLRRRGFKVVRRPAGA